MFIRWERSNVRENIMMSKFAFGDFREGPKVGTRILLCMQWLKLVMSYPLMLLMLWFIIKHTMLFISSTLLGILIFSSVQAFFFAKRNKRAVSGSAIQVIDRTISVVTLLGSEWT